MGRRGPTPKPTAILKLTGSFREDRHGESLELSPETPVCPDWLTTSAKAVWSQVVAWLDAAGVLAKADGNALARYCDAMVRWKHAAQFIDENGEIYTLKDEKGEARCAMAWPQVAMYHQLGSTLLKLEQEFGLTPSARRRIRVPDGKKNESAKARFFGQRAG